MRVRQGRDTMLIAGVPRSRGTPVHFEHWDDTAFTEFTGRGQVTEIHTPRNCALIRIHELLHARHTNQRRYNRVFKDVPDQVGQILEDCRIHAMHWPWGYNRTPASVVKAISDYAAKERGLLEQRLKEEPTGRGSFPDFATRLRMAAVKGAVTHDFESAVKAAGFAPGQERLALSVLAKLRTKKEAKAAALVAIAFGMAPKKPPFRIAGGDGKGGHIPDPDVPVILFDGYEQPDMEIIELDKTEHVEGASIGERRATMGSRLYRPALRRPLLPQRLFIRRTPQEPGGTILIDASGSMGAMENIAKWVQRAPFGTIAYYAGNGREGWLWVFAREGRCAKKVAEPDSRGNTVDGPALTWLMQQPAPRIMVTDREFCDANDSTAQIARLSQLEGAGEVTVVNYNNDDE